MCVTVYVCHSVCAHVCVCVCVCHSVCVCVCGRNELNVYTMLAYPRIGSFCAIHKHMHTRILKPFEDSEPTGLKVDIANMSVDMSRRVLFIMSKQTFDLKVQSWISETLCISFQYQASLRSMGPRTHTVSVGAMQLI